MKTQTTKAQVNLTISTPIPEVNYGYTLEIKVNATKMFGRTIPDLMINFMATHFTSMLLQVESCQINPVQGLHYETNKQYTTIRVIFTPLDETSNFYGPIMEACEKHEYTEWFSEENEASDFFMFILNSFSQFRKFIMNRFVDVIENESPRYEGREGIIRNCHGWVVESVENDDKGAFLYWMDKLKKTGKIQVFGLRHDGDLEKVTRIEKSSLVNPYGWFITTIGKDGKPLYDEKKKKVRDSIKLSKKNYFIGERVNMFDIFDGMDPKMREENV